MSRRKPRIGAWVTYIEGPQDAPERYADCPANWPGTHGHRDHPAIITAVDEDDCADLMVFLDDGPPVARTDVTRLHREKGEEAWCWPGSEHQLSERRHTKKELE
ncbi:MAG: hypothetical protein KGL35_20335 [Bradyrhizobium sp.]|nr:hypothetical protein [Bradyrhizobium sp.]